MKVPRLLVVIPSYGEKNLPFLKQTIHNYQQLDIAETVDLIVLSEAPKNLGPDVKVVVGLPTKNPWTLPFAHKQIFADAVDDYDLFIYTEDDIEILDEHIRAFLEVTPALAPDELAGFFRYEIDAAGNFFYPDVHAFFRWVPDSVRQRGPYTVAEYTNEHAGCYALTQGQLRRVLASGGFLRPPSDGLYGLPETAATDPYTSCGFRKVICISRFDDFLVHHLPNRYLTLGIGLEDRLFQPQLQTLFDIRDGRHPASTLLGNTTTTLWHRRWSKNYYEPVNEELVKCFPYEAETVLSIGCGAGATEKALMDEGALVTALPLDSVIGALAHSTHEIDVIYGDIEEGLKAIGDYRFECILVTNLLHLVSDPYALLSRCIELLLPGGTLLLAGVNLDPLPLFLRRLRHPEQYRELGVWTESGVHALSTDTIRRFLKGAGLYVSPIHRFNRPGAKTQWLGRWAANNWIMTAMTRPRRSSNPESQPVNEKTAPL
jgi:SAM-dependent methyltransferase